MDRAAWIGLLVWLLVVALVWWDEVHRERGERPDDGVDALAERKAHELRE